MKDPIEKKPVRPRDAASLIILRGEGAKSEVLLGRRSAAHRFMPNVHVFPGGRLDAEDYGATSLSDLPEAVKDKLTPKWTLRKTRALARAALRETQEETGLEFGRGNGANFEADLACVDYVGRAITPPVSPIRFHARFFTAHIDASAGDLSDSNELLNLAWYPMRKALELPLVDVTDFMLTTMYRRTMGEELPGTPFFRYLRGAPNIRYE
jgi:8-oxo-dGTP pyrophosphatase MutT (NUDIX family)